MTKIAIQSDGMTHGLTAVGHASGSSAVCAAVSGIVYALGGYLKNLEAAGAVSLSAFTLESGVAELEAAGADARAPFEMAAVGLMQLAARYPKQVSVDAKKFFQIPGGVFAAL